MATACQQTHAAAQRAAATAAAEASHSMHVAPAACLDLVATFSTLLVTKQADNAAAQARHATALQTLEAATAAVDGMQSELDALQPALVAAAAQVEALTATVAMEKEHKAAPVAAAAAAAEAEARGAEEAAAALRAERDTAMAPAAAAHADAAAALDSVKESDVAAARKLPAPPPALKTALEAVCLLLQIKPAKAKDASGKSVEDWWKAGVALLAEKDWVARLKAFSQDEIPTKERSPC